MGSKELFPWESIGSAARGRETRRADSRSCPEPGSVEDAQEQVEEAAQVPGEQVFPVSRGRNMEMFRRLSGFNRPRGIIM